MLKINFGFQNQFGNETNVTKTFNESFVHDTTEFYFLVISLPRPAREERGLSFLSLLIRRLK